MVLRIPELSLLRFAKPSVDPSEALVREYLRILERGNEQGLRDLRLVTLLMRENLYLQHRLETVAEAGESYGLAPLGDPPEATIGLYPTGHFGAYALEGDNGYIILIDSGLIELTYAVSILYSTSRSFITPLGELVPPTLQEADATAIYWEVIRRTLGGEALELYRLPQGTPPQVEEALTLTVGVLDLVIAHEYAHIRLGHLNERESSAPLLGYRAVLYSVDQENSADALAMYMLKRARPWPHPDSAFVCGMVFCELLTALEMARRDGSWLYRVSTHSHPLHRQSTMISSNRVEGFGGDCHAVDGYYLNFRALRGSPIGIPSPESWHEVESEIRSLVEGVDADAYLAVLPRYPDSDQFSGRPIIPDWDRPQQEWDSGALHRLVAADLDAGAAVMLRLVVLVLRTPLVLVFPVGSWLGIAYSAFVSEHCGEGSSEKARRAKHLVETLVPMIDELVVLAGSTIANVEEIEAAAREVREAWPDES